jgi:hypothetical protein
MQTTHQTGGTGTGRRYDFMGRHTRIAQKPADADLASTVSAGRADTDAILACLDQTPQHETSLFFKAAIAKPAQTGFHLASSDSLSPPSIRKMGRAARGTGRKMCACGRRGPAVRFITRQKRDLPVPEQGVSMHAGVSDHAEPARRSR